jgi:hypothetical protein
LLRICVWKEKEACEEERGGETSGKLGGGGESHPTKSMGRVGSNEREGEDEGGLEERERRKLGKRKEGQKHEFICSFYEYMLSFVFLVFTFLCGVYFRMKREREMWGRELKSSLIAKADLI